MGSTTNSEDPGEMPHKPAFHQGLHCLLRHYLSSEKYFSEIITCNCNPSMSTMDIPDLTVSNFMENSIDLKRHQHFDFITD